MPNRGLEDRHIAGPPIEHDGYEFGDDVARAADDDSLSLPNVVPSHLDIVEPRVAHGDAAYEDRLQARTHPQGTGALYLELHTLQDRRLLLRRDLTNDCPARSP